VIVAASPVSIGELLLRLLQDSLSGVLFKLDQFYGDRFATSISLEDSAETPVTELSAQPLSEEFTHVKLGSLLRKFSYTQT